MILQAKYLRSPILAILIAVQFFVPFMSSQAQTAVTATDSGSGSATAAAPPLQLDFSSTEKTMTNSKLSAPVSIQVGENIVQVSSTTLLTPGEYAAAMQVLHSGQQSVVLGDLGNAIGGQVNLTRVHSPIANLVIPQGVTAVNNFGLTSGALNISGNLTNAGTLYAVSTVSQITSASIFANNITNLQSGLITSVLPQAGLPGITGAINNLNLNLTAVNNIINSGGITSAGSLSASAGNSIINSSQSAVMQAMQNVNLQALNVFNAGSIVAQAGSLNVATATLTNQAMMQSVLGNINIVNSVNPALGLNISSSADAVMKALNGSINIGVVDDMAKNAMNIDGGTFIGTGFNINSGEGSLHMNVRDIQAPLDVVKAGLADVAITSGTRGLNIVGFNITGDPNLTYTGAGPYVSAAFNADGGFVNIDTSSDTVNGSITFTGTINTTPVANGSGGSVTLNAGTSITTTNIITSNRNTGSAGAITLTAKTGITTATLNAQGLNNANGGSITLDSGTGSFSLGSLFTSSEDAVDPVGTGTPGALTFKQNGVTLTNPTISFANNAVIGVYGSTAGATSSVQFTMGNANSLDFVITKNIGTGTSGNIIIASPFALNVRQADSDSRGTGGLVQLTSAGAITSTTRISGSGLSNGNAGSVILDSATATFNVDEVYARSQTDPFYSSGGPMGPVNAGTGNGSPGTVLFKQNGVTLANPSITFVGANNREIEVDGTSASPTQGFSINVIGTGGTALGLFGNYNKGTGGTGNVTINASTAITIYGVSTAAVSGTSGDATVAVSGNLIFNGEGIHSSGTSGGNINVSTSAGGNIDLGSDAWVTTGNILLSSAGTLSNAGTMSGNTISIAVASGTISLPSAITGTTSVSLSSPGNIVSATISSITTPLLSLTATAGNIGVAGTPVTIPSANVIANASGSVNLTRAGGLAIAGDSSAGTTFTATASTGTLAITNAANITAGTGALALTATSGSIQTTGGLLRSTSSNVTFTTGAGGTLTSNGNNVRVSAGDSINLTAIAGLLINTAGAGSGGSVELTAGTAVAGGDINGTNVAINTSGTGTGAGGGVSLIANNGGGSLITIGAITANGAGATAGGTNATNGAVSGLTLTSGSTLTVGNINARNTTAGSVVAGGTVNLSANSAATLTVGSIQVDGGLASGNGGSITLVNNGSGGITLNGASVISTATTNGTGGNIIIDGSAGAVDGILNFIGGFTSISTAPTVSGAGGNITLSGSRVNLSGGTLTLNTTGPGAAADGTIIITTTASGVTGDLTIGTTADRINIINPTGSTTVNAGGGLAILTAVSTGSFTGTGQNISLGNTLTAAGTVSLTAIDAISDQNASSGITGNVINLTATNSSISMQSNQSATTSMTAQALNLGIALSGTTSTPTLTVNGGSGGVSVTSTNATTLTANSSDWTTVTDTAANLVIAGGSCGTTSPQTFRVNMTNGNVTQSGAITGSAFTVDLGNASNTAVLNHAGNNIGTLNGAGASGSSLTFSNNTNALQLGTFAAGQNVIVSANQITNWTDNLGLGAVSLTGTAAAGNGIALTNRIGGTDVTLSVPNGNITQTAGGGVIASGILTVNLGAAAGTASLTAGANNAAILTGTGASGSTINLSNGSNALQLGTFVNGQNLTASAGAITTSNDLVLGTVALTGTGAGNAINLTNTINGGSLSLTATTANIVQSATGGITSAGGLTINLGAAAGVATLTAGANNVSTLSGLGAAGSTINYSNGANALPLGTFAAGQNVTATASTITTTANNAALGAVSLTANAVGGNAINISNTLGGTTVSLSTPNANIVTSGAGVINASTSLTANLAGGGNATFTANANNVAQLNGTGSGTVSLNNGANALQLGTFGANQNVNITAAGAITTGAAATFNSLTAVGASFTQGAANVYTIAGATNVTTTGAIILNSAYNGTGNTSFTSTAGNITTNAAVAGDTVTLTASTVAGQTVTMNAGVTGTTAVNVSTSGTLSDGALATINAPSIGLASTLADVTLSGNHTAATSMTLTANAGAVSSSGVLTTPTLTASAGNGGVSISSTTATTLTANSSGDTNVTDSAASVAIAGGSAGVGNTFTINTVNGNVTQTGAITGGTLTVNLGNAANAATLNNAGNNVGTLNATGAAGGISYTDSNALALGSFVAGQGLTVTAGTITTSANNGALGAVSLTANAVGGNAINISNTLGGTTVSLSTPNANIATSGAGVINASTSLTANLAGGGNATFTVNANNVAQLNGTGSGTVSLNNGANALQLGTFGANQNVNVTAAGAITTGAAATFNSLTAAGASFTQGAANVYTIAGATNVTTTGGIILNSAYNGTGNTSFTSTAGNITTNAAVTGDTVTLTASTVAGQTVTMNSGVTGTTAVNVSTSGALSDGALATINAPSIGLTSTLADVTLSGNHTAATSMTLTANAGAVSSTGILTTPTLTAGAGNGGISIGSTSATTLTANSSGDTNVTDSAAAVVIAGGSAGAGNTFTINTVNGNVTQTGAITGGTLTVDLGNAANTATLNNVGNDVGTLNAIGAAGGISYTDVNALALGSFVAGQGLTVAAGTLTTSANNGALGAVSLTANAVGGNAINISNTLGGTVINLSTPNASMVESGAGVINASTSLTANLAGGGNATFIVNANNVAQLNGTGGGTISLNNGANALQLGTFGANQNVVITSSGAITTSGAATFNSLNAAGTSFTQGAGHIYTVAGVTNVSTTGGITLDAAYNGIGNTSFVSTGGNIVTAGVVAGDTVALTASTVAGQSITLGGAVNGTSAATIASTGTFSGGAGAPITAPVISITSTQGDVSLAGAYNGSTSISLNATSGGINSTGTLTGPILAANAGAGGLSVAATNASTLTANSSGTTAVTDNFAGVVNILGGSAGNAAGNSFTVNATGGGLTTAGAISGYDVTLQANTAGGSTITLGAALTGNNSVSLLTAGSITDASGLAQIVTPRLNLTSGAGAVNLTGNYTAGTSMNLQAATGIASTGVLTTASLSVNSTAGDVGVVSTSATDLTAVSSGNTTIGASAGGLITLNGSSAGLGAGNTFALTTSAGNVQLAAGATVQGGTVNITTPTANSISVGGGRTITGRAVNLQTGTLTNDGAVTATVNGVAVSSLGGLNVSGVGSISSPTQLTLSVAAGQTLSIGGNLSIGQAATVNAVGGTLSNAGIFSAPSLTVDAATLSNNGTISATAGNFDMSSSVVVPVSVTNTGTISATNTLTLAGAGGLSVGGAGTLTGAAGIAASSSGGAVSLVQDNFNGDISGSAATSYAVSAGASALSAGSITAAGGNLTLTAVANNASIVGGANLTALNNVSVNGSTGVTANANAVLTGGTVNGAFNAFSTNMADFDMTGITNTGAVSLTSSGGAVNVANGVNLVSRGANVAITSATTTTIGAGGSMFAQAGNVTVDAGTTLTINGGAMTSVARSIPGNPPLVIDGQVIPDFAGGGIALMGGTPGTNLNALLRTTALARIGTGTYFASPGVITTGSTFTYVPNGGYVGLILKGAGSLSVLGSNFTANGGVLLVDPPTNVFITGLTLAAFQSALVPVPPPPPPVPPGPGGGGAAAASASSGSTSAGITLLVADSSVNNLNAQAQSVTAKDVNLTALTAPSVATDSSGHCVPAPMGNFIDGEATWFVATGTCETFSYEGQDGTTVVGKGGTAVAPAGVHVLEMRTGNMYAMSGATPISVKTKQGSVELPPDSSALIEENHKGVLRVAFVTGQAGSVDVVAKGQKTQVKAVAGQEVLIASADADEEDLIPTDGVDRVVVSASVQVGGLTVQKSRYSRKEMVEKSILLNCNSNCFPAHIRARLETMKQQVAVPDDISAAPQESDSHLKPISQTRLAAVAAPRALATFEIPSATIKHLDSARFTISSDNHVQVSAGEVVVVARKQMIVSTSQSDVTLVAGSIAAIWSDGLTTKVRSLWDAKANGVSLVSHGRAVAAGAGQEVIVSKDESVLQKHLQIDTNARRRVRIADLPGGSILMSSEISFVSLITQSPVLMKIFDSKAEGDTAIGDKLRKMAVCLSIAAGKHGAYSSSRPKD